MINLAKTALHHCRELLWLVCFSSLWAQSRDLRFERISVEQGLSNITPTKIAQDQQGFLWFGTEDGLNKYDGYEFTVYKPDPADSNALPDRVVQALYADRAGNLWVGAGHEGLRRYNPAQREKFDRFKHDPRDPHSLAGKYVNVLFEDRRGDLWIGTNKGLYRYGGFQLGGQVCSPRPLWAAVKANKLAVATVPHEGAGLRFLRTHLENAI